MALGTPTNLGTGNGATSATSGSGTPAALARMFALVTVRRSSGGDANAVTISDSDGLSSGAGDWTELVATGGTLLTGTGSLRQQIFTRMSSASPAALTVSTSTSASATGVGIICSYIAGGQTDLSNIKVDTDTAGDPAATLDVTPDANSTVLNWFSGYNVVAIGQPANYTVLTSTSVPTNQIRHAIAYDAGSAAAAAAWSTTATNSILTMLEIKLLADVTGTGAGNIVALAGAASGAHGVAGTAAGSIAALVGAAAGVHGVAGAGLGNIAALAGAASGAHGVAGTAAGQVFALVGSASGAHGVAGAGAGLISRLIGDASGTHDGGDPDPGDATLLNRPFLASVGCLMGRR